MRRAAFALALAVTGLAAPLPAVAQLEPYSTSECFAFWQLLEKLRRDGVDAIVAAGPKTPEGGLPEAQMERVTLYLDLEEKLRFRCPDFAPPPDRAPGKREPAEAPVVTARPGDAAPAGTATPGPAAGAVAIEPKPPAAQPSGPPMPLRRPAR